MLFSVAHWSAQMMDFAFHEDILEDADENVLYLLH